MKQGVIFDMDGTLFNTEQIYRDSWETLIKDFNQIHNPDFPMAVCGSNGETLRRIVKEYYPTIDADAYIKAVMERTHNIMETYVPEKPGLHEILDYFKKCNLKMAVASSSSKDVIEHHLQFTGIYDYFDAIVGGDEVEHGKPAPDIFLRSAKKLGIAPSDCYVFEDSINGIRSGVAAGCTTIMIPDVTPPNEELRQICSGIYDSFFTAIDAIQKNEI